MGEIRVPDGLAGVTVADTWLGGVRGDEGFFHYLQYSAAELAAKRDLEDVWHLLRTGLLPDAAQTERFTTRVAGHRAVPEEVLVAVAAAARLGIGRPSLLWVRSAASLLAEWLAIETWIGRPIEDVAMEAERLVAALPTVIASGWRAQQNLAPIEPDPSLPLAANFLAMLGGERTHAQAARALEQYLILTVDHGFNASTFTARTVASTGGDVGSAVVAGIAALSGPLHGGAPSLALEMLEEIGSVANIRPWVRDRLTAGGVIMGFGHRVYRTEDPRAAMLRDVAQQIGGPLVELAVAAEQIIVEELDRHRPGRDLRTNVEFYTGVVLNLVGVPTDLFPACFAISRSIGWSAHVLEQIAENRIIRPKAAYVGVPAPVPVPLPTAAGHSEPSARPRDQSR